MGSRVCGSALVPRRAEAAGQQAAVVGDVHQRHSHPLERAAHLHHRVVGRQGLELVLGGLELALGRLNRPQFFHQLGFRFNLFGLVILYKR